VNRIKNKINRAENWINEKSILTEIEEMLIAQTFPIVSIYYLCGGQYAYSGNVINFPQDIINPVIDHMILY
jgi:hypothetical protein